MAHALTELELGVRGCGHGRRRKHGGVLINTGGASALGKMLVKVAAAERLTLMSVVRSEAQRQVLLSLGAEHVLVSPTRIVMEPTTVTEHAEQVRPHPNLEPEPQSARAGVKMRSTSKRSMAADEGQTHLSTR
jgi:NADPH:quinone reductase-like Zn-dependent oxidoreductase